MLVNKAYKYRLKLNQEQIGKCEAYAGHCRFLWNKFLQINLLRLRNKQKIMYYQEMDFFSKLYKNSTEYGFLAEAPAHCVQQKLKDLEKAFKDCFDKTQPNKRLPRMRKKNIHDSFRFPEPKHLELDNNRIKLPKLGLVRFFKSRSIIGEIKNVTITKEGNHWYISICALTEIKQTSRQELNTITTSSVGIDLGVKNFVTLSTGEKIKSVNLYETYGKKLAILQRRLAKKKKFSSNWKKAVLSINKLHRKMVHIRKDFINKVSTSLSKSHAMVVVEALLIKNMTKSSKGTLETPGKNVKAKSGLNRSILSMGWGEFKGKLKYKLEWSGGTLIEVSPRFTSQKCSKCEHIAKENRKTQSIFCCVKCSHIEHADVNAAKNVLAAAGHAVKACGASAKSVSPLGVANSAAMKQEPTKSFARGNPLYL